MQSQQLVNGNFVLGKAGLTGLSGAATTYTIGTAFAFALGGKAYSKGTAAGAATPTTDAATSNAISLAAGKGTVILWCVDSTGTVKLVQGTVEALDATSGNFLSGVPNFPALDDSLVPFAYSVHKNVAGSAAFVIGTSLWNQTGSTHTVQDIITLPGRPQQS